MDKNSIGIALVALVIGGIIGYSVVSRDEAVGMMGGRSGMVDRHFIEQMIPHHEGAIEMAKLAEEKSTRPEILSLASNIIETQTAEIRSMTEWYEEWYGTAPIDRGMGHGLGHMRGMGMEGDLDQLRTSENFDVDFLNQMIIHHEMAVMMASMLARGTEREEMKNLAEQIIESQNSEIESMKQWRSEWSGASSIGQ